MLLEEEQEGNVYAGNDFSPDLGQGETRLVSKLHRMLRDSIVRKIAKNAGIVFFGNSVASALNIVSFALMARALGPETLAVFVLAQTYALLVNDIFNIQTWESMIKFGSHAHNDPKGFVNIVKTNIALDVISAAVAFIAALILVSPASSLFHWPLSFHRPILLYSLSILSNITTLTIGIPRLFDKFRSIAIIQIVVAGGRIACVGYAYLSGQELMAYVWIYLIMESTANVSLILYSTLLLKREYGRMWRRVPFSLNRHQAKFIWWTNIRSIVRIPVRRLDMVIISSVMSLQTVGIFKVYKEITGILGRIGDPVNQAIYPVFARLIGEGQAEESRVVAGKTIFLMSGVSIFLTGLLFFSAGFIVNQFFGSEYSTQMPALYLMLVLGALSFLTTPINSLFIAAGFARLAFYVVLLTNTVYFFVAYFLGRVIGIYGIVAANATQMFLNQSLKLYLMKRNPSGWRSRVR